MQPKSNYLDLQDIRLHYYEWEGNGPPAVMVHGSGLCGLVWKPLAEALAPRFRVLAIDLRGHGHSDKPTGHYTCPEVVGDFPQFLDALDLRDVLLVGHSRGGGVSALGGSQRPERIWRSVFMEPSINIGSPPPLAPGQAAPPNQLAGITRRRRVLWPDRQLVFRAWKLTETLKNWREDVLWAYIEEGTQVHEDGQVELLCPPEVEAEFYEHRTPDWMYETLPNITWPVLLLTTDGPRRQPMASQGTQALMNSSCDFRHVVIAGASHFFPQERPDEVNRAVLEFVNS